MKSIKVFVSALFIATFFMGTATAQTADEIIDGYHQTIGGKDKLRTIKGTLSEMVVNAQGMEIPVQVAQLKGGKMYVKVNFQGKEIMQMVSDGETMWTTNFQTMKPERLDAETMENEKLSNQDFPDALLDYASKGYSAEYVGKETKEGTECHKIKFIKKPIKVNGIATDDIVYYYFDTENNLLILQEEEIIEGPMAGQKSKITMSDYQEVEGLYFPFSINQDGQALTVKKMTLNPELDEKVFAFPQE